MKKLFVFIFKIAFFLFLFSFKSSQVEASQIITIESYRTQAASMNLNNQAEYVPFSKSLVEIYYFDAEGAKNIVTTTVTDSLGYISNISLDIPDSINRNQLFFRYILKNDSYGYLINDDNNQYAAITSIFIPANKIIKTDTTREFPNSDIITSAAKTWELFVSSVDQVITSVEYAEENTSFKLESAFEFKPIFIKYEKNQSLGNYFAISQSNMGLLRLGTPYISIDDSAVNDRLINLSHEWSHWIMYSALNGFNTGGGHYNDRYSVCDPRVSWKEGWALTQSNLIATALGNWPYNSYQFGRLQFDTSPQSNNVTGKSTLSTVNGVLIDIFDKDYTYNGLEGVNEEEFFDLASEHSLLEGNFNKDRAMKDSKLANGLLIIAMVNSKATTLSEYIQYLRNNGYIINDAQFDDMLSLNGIDSMGNFTMN